MCKLYEIAYALRQIFPKVIRNTMLFYAESKMKSPLIETRISSMTFLGKMFSASDSKLACTEEKFFSNFLGRIKDPSVEIRLLLIEFFRRIILKHPEVRIITSLHLRQTQVDPETRVRIEGVTSISKAIFKDIMILEGNVDLQQFLRGVKPDLEVIKLSFSVFLMFFFTGNGNSIFSQFFSDLKERNCLFTIFVLILKGNDLFLTFVSQFSLCGKGINSVFFTLYLKMKGGYFFSIIFHSWKR